MLDIKFLGFSPVNLLEYIMAHFYKKRHIDRTLECHHASNVKSPRKQLYWNMLICLK